LQASPGPGAPPAAELQLRISELASLQQQLSATLNTMGSCRTVLDSPQPALLPLDAASIPPEQMPAVLGTQLLQVRLLWQ
jgi:hypothetical protein